MAALLLCNIHPKPPPSITHHRKRLHLVAYIRLCLSAPKPSASPRRRIVLPPPKAASINGFSVQNPVVSPDRQGEENLELVERLRRWIGFIRSVFPGGSWWSFDEDVHVRMLAEPVTVSRALLRMWQLVAQDRWVIFAAFAALILAAVRALLIFGNIANINSCTISSCPKLYLNTVLFVLGLIS